MEMNLEAIIKNAIAEALKANTEAIQNEVAKNKKTDKVTAPQNAAPKEKKEEANKEPNKVYQIITDRFIAALANGDVPWTRGWISLTGARTGAWSHKSGESYSVINQMLLPEPGEYITRRQINEEGGTLKEGAIGYPVTFYKSNKVTVRNPRTNVDEEKYIPVLRYYLVFRMCDVEGIKQKYQPDLSALNGAKEPAKCKKAEEIIKNYLNVSGVKLKSEAMDAKTMSPHYSPIHDEIVLPLKKQFKNKAAYYGTAFHEIVHSTGHRDRLNRFSTITAARGQEYSLEELVAEIGSCCILNGLSLETKDSINNSEAYVKGWLKALKNDANMIIKASGRAQKAVKYIIEGPDSVKPQHDVPKVDYTEPVPAQ